MKEKKQKYFLITVFIIGLLLDQVTKFIAFKKQLIIENKILNPNRNYIIIISIIVIFMIIRYISNNNYYIKMNIKAILTLAVSGIVGNLIDRIWNVEPIVFINIHKGISFNLAYIYIIIAWVGVAFFLTKNTSKMIREKRKRINNENNCK